MEFTPITPGRIVHVYPNQDPVLNSSIKRLMNNPTTLFVAGIVTSISSDTSASIQTFFDTQTGFEYDIEHKSVAKEGFAYWDYPTIVAKEPVQLSTEEPKPGTATEEQPKNTEESQREQVTEEQKPETATEEQQANTEQQQHEQVTEEQKPETATEEQQANTEEQQQQ